MIPWWALLLILPLVFFGGILAGRFIADDRDWKLRSLEGTSKRLIDHMEQALKLQRQRRIINRLRREIEELKAPTEKGHE